MKFVLISESLNELRELCEKNRIEVTPPITNVKLFDALVEHFIERHCLQPTFLCDFPICTSPLARHHRSKVCPFLSLFLHHVERILMCSID